MKYKYLYLIKSPAYDFVHFGLDVPLHVQLFVVLEALCRVLERVKGVPAHQKVQDVHDQQGQPVP